MDKEDRCTYIYTCTYIHTYNGICSATEKNEILPFATPWMNLYGTMPSEISKTEKDKYCVISLIYATSKIQPSSE